MLRRMDMHRRNLTLLVLLGLTACTHHATAPHAAGTPQPVSSSPAHPVGTPSVGTLTLAQMNALRDRITHDQPTLAASGVRLVHWGPDSAHRLVAVGVSSDLAQARRVLVARYGDVLLVRQADAGHRT
jgi:hypothetical protein